MSSNGSSDVIVVGGGVIGCAIAYYLACEGVAVAVVERGEIGCEASGAAAGMLAPLAEVEEDGPFQEMAIDGLRLFPALAETLRAESGVDIEYLTSGILRVAVERGGRAAPRAGWRSDSMAACRCTGCRRKRRARSSRRCRQRSAGRCTRRRSTRSTPTGWCALSPARPPLQGATLLPRLPRRAGC